MSAAQAAFCLIVSGFVVYEIFTEWSVTKGLLLWAPMRLEQAFTISNIWTCGMVKSIMLFVVLPAFFWLVPFVLFRMAGGWLSMRDYFLRFGIVFIPIMAAAHAIKALLKMISRIPYWEYAARDPVGVETAQGIIDKTVTLTPLPFWFEPATTISSLVIMGAAIILSLLVVRKLNAAYIVKQGWCHMLFYLIPLMYGGTFFTMLISWRLF
jgi:hypothetical protein